MAAVGNKMPRTRLSDVFLKDCLALWHTHGNQALADMLNDSPVKFCQMIAGILPKHIELDNTDGINWVINASPRLTEDEWRQQHNLIDQDPTETA